MTVIDASPSYQPHAAQLAQELFDAGVRRAILKTTEGATWPPAAEPPQMGEEPSAEYLASVWFGQTKQALHAVGIEVEIYHLTHGVDDPHAEAVNVVRVAGGQVSGFVWIDSESVEGNAAVERTHINEVAAELARALPAARIGEYVNRSTLAAMGGVAGANGRPLWLAIPNWKEGDELDPAVVLVQYGTESFGGEVFDVNAAPKPPAPKPPVVQSSLGYVDLRGADAHLVIGPGVKTLQALLFNAGYLTATQIDGKGGPITRRALVSFQHANGLVPDAIAGPATFAKLEAE